MYVCVHACLRVREFSGLLQSEIWLDSDLEVYLS